MAEINVETLLKRAAMLEEEKDYSEALSVYNRILEAEPDNETAYQRRKAIKNNTLTIKREKIIGIEDLSTVYLHYICLDGEKLDSQSWIYNMAPADYTVNVALGKHRLTLWSVASRANSVPKEVINYDFEVTQPNQVIYLRHTRSGGIHFTTLAHEEGANAGGSGGGGCYVATAVYGSYDCPEVWTLRRFRDDVLADTWYGRAFIHTYYAISPTLVKWFGKTAWFKKLWKPTLDKMVARLNNGGVDNTPYNDREW